jgi:excisionase family DNA binding protein
LAQDERGASVQGYDTTMAREADFYTAGEAAQLLRLSEMTVLGLLTSGQLEGYQDERARWCIPASIIERAIQASRAPDNTVDSLAETIALPLKSVEEPTTAIGEDTTQESDPVYREEQAAGVDADSAAESETTSGWVTTKVAAEALGVNPRTVRTYIERGDLQAKVEGEGVEKAYLVSIDSVYSLRERRGAPRKTRRKIREKSAPNHAPADLAEIVRDLTADLVRAKSEAADLRARLELTEQAQSTRDAEAARLREENERLRTELEAERSKGFWRRLFGG